MKRWLISLYVKVHKPSNKIFVFLWNFAHCFYGRCAKQQKKINRYIRHIRYIHNMSKRKTQFINKLVDFYLNTTTEFRWTPDYLGGLIDIHPDALMFLLEKERDDCDGPASFITDLIKSAQLFPKFGIIIRKVILFTDDPIYSPKFWRRLHVVVIINNRLILSNGTAYYAEHYFKGTYYSWRNIIVYEKIEV